MRGPAGFQPPKAPSKQSATRNATSSRHGAAATCTARGRPVLDSPHHGGRPPRNVEGHGVAETAEIVVADGFAVRQCGVDVGRAKNRVVAAEESGHLRTIRVQLGPVSRQAGQIRAIRLQLVEPGSKQRMDFTRTQITQIVPQAVAAIRADQLHLQVVGRRQTGWAGFLHRANLGGESRSRSPNHTRDLSIRRRDSVIDEERHP